MTHHPISRKTSLIFVLMLFFVVATVNAAPTMQQNEQISGLFLQHVPPNSNYPVGESHYLHFHLYESDTGLIVNTSDYNCSYHLYKHPVQDHEISNGNLTPYGAGYYDYINESYFSQEGVYTVLTWCVGATRGGFLEYSFTVGEEIENNVFALIFGLAVAMFVLLYFSFNIEKDHSLLRLICYIFVFMMLIMIPASFYLGNNIVKLFLNLTITLMTLFAAYIVFKYIFDVLRYVGLMRK